MATIERGEIQIMGHVYEIIIVKGHQNFYECDYCDEMADSMWRMDDQSVKPNTVVDWGYACRDCYDRILFNFTNPKSIRRK
jgi:hypothetical protein